MVGDKDETDQETPRFSAYSGNSSIRVKSLQREQIIAQIFTTKTYSDVLFEMSVHQLDVKFSLLERQLKSFEQLQMDLESLDESQRSQNHRAIFEDAYFEIKSLILERLAIIRANASETVLSSTRVMPQTQSHSQRPHLPTLQLSKFSGNYKDWLEFYNMFRVLVHDNQELSQVSKFQYLRSCLTDGAARVIQSLEVTAQNYEHAIDLLTTRYDNKRQLFQSNLFEIFDVQKLNKPSVSSLRLFIDNINSSMRALESIASEYQIANGIILHLVVSKLDTESQAKWEDYLSFFRDQSTSSTTLKIPSWNELACFLERRCKTLEIFESSCIQSARNQPSRSTQQTSFVTSRQQPKCNICDIVPSHSVFRCTKFVDMNVGDRFKTVKRLQLCLNCLGVNHIANSCPSLNRCQQCGVAHHTLLHKESTISPTICSDAGTSTQPETSNHEHKSTVSLHSSQGSNVVILATAMIELCTPTGTSIIGRALLDSCSQSNFITERMAQHLRLPRKRINVNICGIGGVDSICVKNSCTITAKSLTSGFASTFDAVIISTISSRHPHCLINTTNWNVPANIKLADSTFNVPGPVDLLIGADLFWDLLMVGRIIIDNQPNFIKTKLGWIVSGSADTDSYMSKLNSTQLTSLQYSPLHASLQKSAVFMIENNKQTLERTTVTPAKYNQLISSSLENLLQSFWQLEQCDLNKNKLLSSDEAACEKWFEETTKRCPYTNKFIVRLPFKVINLDIGQSRQTAQRRFTYLEAKFGRDAIIKKEYTDFIDEYIAMNHMSPIAADKALYHIPHHCVIKPESSTTRLRVVFDASCVTTNGKSLNDLLLVGPTLQDNVFTILSRFRYNKFVLVADIAKMYRQVLVDDDDMKWQCILWRKNVYEPLKTYKLPTVTYGTSCAPYLAVKCLQQLAYEETNNYPIGAKVTLQDFYVDNLMTGGSTEEEVIEIKRQVTELLMRGGFPLRKFASNSETVLSGVPQSDREAIVDVENMQYVKTLGLKWSPTEDVFSFSYPQQQKKPCTSKRSILSHMASFFDPLGFINPIIVRCKMLIRDLWKLKLHWDESVPHDIYLEWKHIREELHLIGQIKIPRYVDFDTRTNIPIFVDASKRAYGACVYAVTYRNNDVKSNLLCAKSRVAPTKEVSLPRLELCAALLASQLLHSIKTCSNPV